MEPSVYRIRLRRDELDRACEAAGLNSAYALARVIGMNRSTVTRILAGDLQPGAAFIAGVVAVFARFDRYFEVVRGETEVVVPGIDSGRTPQGDVEDVGRARRAA
ncbi:helix-turn-helix transcriptional regulator [Saccharothrix sp. BKS2]|uniref:helix-turn-helix domain-containing protein n=1 Tax=Saccharothrix sp. BKS2 TaxID=3064400 RepID=UPI0039E95F08